ncbi:response regulator transcription factor [Deminuibacter soli]|uniref:DNA-binding response regulator n=1 Tax=Deminuibacter soli TaxID=2291815 RepID=A0A3E1NDU0_9BACT|nr:response regulator transcription factor [Deminuibacter soli]RFM26120.1 DNA-binding response regulator [Deminuibacter soli]
MNILLVEDESAVASFIQRGLLEAGHQVALAMDGNTGLQMALAHTFDLLLLDVMLPGINGIELCRSFRTQNTQTPVLMLTALSATENVVNGLDSGADDYLVKPFKLAELLARIRSLARRSGQPGTPAANMLQLADLQVDLDGKTVQRNGRSITLTATEFRLLVYLLQNKKRVLNRMEILENVWDVNFDMGTNVVDVYVNYLRRKIDKHFSPKLIHTVVGMGYVLKEVYDHEDSN